VHCSYAVAASDAAQLSDALRVGLSSLPSKTFLTSSWPVSGKAARSWGSSC